MINVLPTLQDIYTKMCGLFFVHMIDEMTAIAIRFNNYRKAHPRKNKLIVLVKNVYRVHLAIKGISQHHFVIVPASCVYK